MEETTNTSCCNINITMPSTKETSSQSNAIQASHLTNYLNLKSSRDLSN